MVTPSTSAGADKPAGPAATPRKPRTRKPTAAKSKVVKPSRIGAESGIRKQAEKLKTDATERARKAAKVASDKAGGIMDDVAATVHDAAEALEKRFGTHYGDYARRAGEAVTAAAASVKKSEIEDLVSAARKFVKKNPVVAAGTAAAIGFALVRLFRAQDEEGEDDLDV